MKSWQKWCLAVFAGGAVIHVAAIWGAPRFIMKIALDRTTVAASGANVFLHAPRASAERRTIVRPSPDLSYSICVADVSKGPIRVIAPVSEPYTSVSVFAANSDNVLALNDRQTDGKPIEILVAGRGQSVPEGVPVARLNSERAIVLVRRVIKDDQHEKQLDPIRGQATCGAS
jgi:uncharacterized membrane protein